MLRRQSHKVFIGGLPQNVTEGELLKYFEKVAGPVADVLILMVRLAKDDHLLGKSVTTGFVPACFRTICLAGIEALLS
jgi:RNA recognition motif-containing protein